MKNVFNQADTQELVDRVNKLSPTTERLWGTMTVDQMLAHYNVTYEMAYTDKHTKPGAFKKFLLKLFVKNTVVNEKPYPKNSRTAPQFFGKGGDKDFEAGKKRLVDYILKTQALGASHFKGKESHSFGPLLSSEWNNMFYKHLNHYLEQFGV